MIGVSGTDMEFEIIGFSTKTTYQTALVIFMKMSTWQIYRYNTPTPPDLFSGVIVRGVVDVSIIYYRLLQPGSAQLTFNDYFLNYYCLY